MHERKLLAGAAACLLLVGLTAVGQRAAKRRPVLGPICGDPTTRCKTSYDFKPADLPFQIPARAVIWESVPFYAVILKSVKAKPEDCEARVPEAERLEAQKLFPHHKVFTDTDCGVPGDPYYTGTRHTARFMAVYAGRTRAEALRFLEEVKATGKFPGANLRHMSIGFNGT